MNRRSFLTKFGLGAAAALAAPQLILHDPELAAWRPGTKSIFDLGRFKRPAAPTMFDVKYGWAMLRPDHAVTITLPPPPAGQSFWIYNHQELPVTITTTDNTGYVYAPNVTVWAPSNTVTIQSTLGRWEVVDVVQKHEKASQVGYPALVKDIG